MIEVRKGEDRGKADFGWLDSRHSFSFGQYMDPKHMGFRGLRVINEDRIRPGSGFGTHGHRDMEIISYVLDGALAHKDSMGNGAAILPGEVQLMSAGTGVMHSEYNHAQDSDTHFLQMWVIPSRQGVTPGYQQKAFLNGGPSPGWVLAVDPEGREGALTINADARLYVARAEAGSTLTHSLAAGRGAWLQVARGAVVLNGERLEAGDGAAVEDVPTLTIEVTQAAELLLYDLG